MSPGEPSLEEPEIFEPADDDRDFELLVADRFDDQAAADLYNEGC